MIKWPPFCRRHFETHFIEWKCSITISLHIVPWCPTDKTILTRLTTQVGTGSHNSLVLNRRGGCGWFPRPYHYIDVIMTTMAPQITSLTVVYSTIYSDADQRKHQSSALLAFVWGIHRDRWIPRTKGQLRGKCFHLMTSSWFFRTASLAQEQSCAYVRTHRITD